MPRSYCVSELERQADSYCDKICYDLLPRPLCIQLVEVPLPEPIVSKSVASVHCWTTHLPLAFPLAPPFLSLLCVAAFQPPFLFTLLSKGCTTTTTTDCPLSFTTSQQYSIMRKQRTMTGCMLWHLQRSSAAILA